MPPFFRPAPPLVVLTAALLSAGCASRGQPDDSAPPADEQPGMAAWEDAQHEGIPLARLFGFDRSRNTEEREAQQQRVAQLERQLQELALRQEQREDGRRAAPVAGITDGPQFKLGLAFDGAGSPAEHQLHAALAEAAANHALTVVGPGAVRDALAAAGCAAGQPQPCLDALATYPGLRLLAVVSLDAAPDGTQVAGRMTLRDAMLGAGYAPVAVELPAVDGQVTRAAMTALADAILLTAADKARLAPWSARAFSEDGGRWHVNAGARSGLAVGDVLEVRDGGSTVRAPSGLPAAWIPGPVKGRLRVERLIGDDVAVAALIDGAPPARSDPLHAAD